MNPHKMRLQQHIERVDREMKLLKRAGHKRPEDVLGNIVDKVIGANKKDREWVFSKYTRVLLLP